MPQAMKSHVSFNTHILCVWDDGGGEGREVRKESEVSCDRDYQNLNIKGPLVSSE